MKKHFLLLAALCAAGSTIYAQDIPLVYSVENTGADANPVLPTKAEGRKIEVLPDPFEWSDGSGRIASFADWAKRRGEIAKEIQHYEIGEKPVVDASAVSAQMDGNTLRVAVTVGGETLNLSAEITYPTEGEAPYALMIGTSGISLPSDVFKGRPIARMTFSESQVNSYSQMGGSSDRTKFNFVRLYPELIDNGAYSEWAWGLSRLIDGLQLLGPEVTKIDMARIGVTGCSYAGKMALFCGAFDERVALTIAQEPGGGGAAAWRYSRWLNAQPNAESVESLDKTDYNWFMTSLRDTYGGREVAYLPYDHHELAAMVCPRALLMLGNPDYVWLADPSAYVSMNGAMKVWEQYGIDDRVGYSIVAGHGHCSLPQSQYPEVEAYLDRFLLDKTDVDTRVRIAPESYSNIDLDLWTGWWGQGEPNELPADPYIPNGPKKGTLDQLPLVGNWASSVSGDAADDGNIYSGTVSFSFRWGEVGGAAWKGDVNDGSKHVITVKTAQPLPEGLQWKIAYLDEYGEPLPEVYEQIPAGSTEASYQLTKSYSYAAVQRLAQENLDPVNVLSVTRWTTFANDDDFTPSSENLPLKTNTKATIVREGEEEVVIGPNGLPATVSLPGNWGDVKLWKSSFSIDDYPRYRIELWQPIGADATMQMFLRNAAQAASYGGHYYPFQADQTVMEGTFNPDDLEEDHVVTQFALQNMTGNRITAIVKDVVLIDKDGNEVHTEGLRADGWNPAKVTPGISADAQPVYEGTVKFNEQNGWLGSYAATVDEGTYHRLTFTTAAPLPEGFQLFVSYTDADKEDETIDLGESATTAKATGIRKVESSEPNAYAIDVLSSYSTLVLQYVGESAPVEVYFNSVKRDVQLATPDVLAPDLIATGITTTAAPLLPASNAIYNLSGQAQSQLQRGINLVRRTMPDGQVRTVKVVVR